MQSSWLRDIIFVLRCKTLAFLRHLRHSKYSLDTTIVYHWVLRILFIQRYSLCITIQNTWILKNIPCSRMFSFYYDWIRLDYWESSLNNFLFVLQLNMIDSWTNSLLKDLIFALRLNTITSSRIFSLNNKMYYDSIR